MGAVRAGEGDGGVELGHGGAGVVEEEGGEEVEGGVEVPVTMATPLLILTIVKVRIINVNHYLFLQSFNYFVYILKSVK